MQNSIIRFLEELESHCYKSAIATFAGSQGKPFVIDLQRYGSRVTFGYQKNVKDVFITKLLLDSNPTGSLILRSFTPEIDELTQLPIKELRGYVLRYLGDKLEFEQLSPTDLFACQNTDAKTGEPLPLEQSVRYC